MTAPATAQLQLAGRYSVAELAPQARTFEPYALPLRLALLKNGSLQECDRFHTIQELFSRLALGRGVELSFQISHSASGSWACLCRRPGGHRLIIPVCDDS
jgi:hypothetical protein